jgi:putative sterol carrier protein
VTQTAREVFQLHRLQKHKPFLRGVHGTYLFDIEGVGNWFVKVDDGAIKMDNERHEADCTIRCNEEDFVSIVEGRRNLLTAVLQGRGED